MAKHLLENEAAEQEATDIAYQFMNSQDVMSDMETAYGTSFSHINIHSDEAADAKVKAAGRDAIASGNDIFFGKGILESNTPESKGLMAHELTHIMQQSGEAASMGLSESVSYGAEEGGLLDMFRNWNAKRKLNNARAVAKSRPLDVKGGAATATDMATALDFSKAAVIASDEALENSRSKGDDISMQISRAFQGFGHRNSNNAISQNERQLRGNLMGGRNAAYLDYMNKMYSSDADFSRLQEGLDVTDKHQRANEFTSGIAMDLMDISEQFALSDSGLDYFRLMVNQVKDAKVFKNTGVSAIDYVLQTYLTGDAGDMTTQMTKAENADKLDDKAKSNARNVLMEGSKEVLYAPAIVNKMLSENKTLDQMNLKPELRAVVERYMLMKDRISAAMGDQDRVVNTKMDGNKTTDFANGRSFMIGKIAQAATREEAQNPMIQKLVLDDFEQNMTDRLKDETSVSSAQSKFRAGAGELFSANKMITKLMPEDMVAKVSEKIDEGDVEAGMDYIGRYYVRDFAENEYGAARFMNGMYSAFDNQTVLGTDELQQELIANNFILRNIAPTMALNGEVKKSQSFMRAVNGSNQYADNKSVQAKRSWLQRMFRRR